MRMVLPVLRGPFTVEAYQRLAQVGILREDARVELIAGQVVEMTPIDGSLAASNTPRFAWCPGETQ
jgi:hypothetical protein